MVSWNSAKTNARTPLSRVKRLHYRHTVLRYAAGKVAGDAHIKRAVASAGEAVNTRASSPMVAAPALGPRFRGDDELRGEMPHVYAALLEPELEGGFTVTFPDIGYGATYGATWEEALLQAEDMLEEAVLGMIAHNEEVPAPSPAKGRPTARLAALTAAKLEVYRAMRQAGLDASQLAERLGWSPKKITHIFDGYHVVRLEQLEAALAALGRRFVVTSEPV